MDEKVAALKGALAELLAELSAAETANKHDDVEALEQEKAALESSLADLEADTEEPETIQTDPIKDEKAFWDNAEKVGKEKGLPGLDGRSIKHMFSGSIVNEKTGKTLETEKARPKRLKKSDDYRPTADQLAKINKYSNVDLGENDVYVFTAKVCDQELDRHMEMLRPKALQSGAKMLPDSPIQCNHWMDVESSVGKTFEGKVSNKALWGSFYVLDVEENKTLLNKMFSGIINKMSVHFALNAKDYVCSSCNKSLYSMECKHWPGMQDEKGQIVVAYVMDMSDYFETSLVSVPAQPKAGFRRNANDDEEDSEKAKAASLDKISNVSKTVGESTVDPNELQTPNADDVKPPVDAAANETADNAKSADTQTAPADETSNEAPKNKKLNALKATVASLQEEVKALAEVAKLVVESVKGSNETLKKLVDASNKQSELVTKATNTIDERFIPQTVETINETAGKAKEFVDMTMPGGLLGAIGKSLENK